MTNLLNDELNLRLLKEICSGNGVEVNISELSRSLKKHRNTIRDRIEPLFENNIINKPIYPFFWLFKEYPLMVITRADLPRDELTNYFIETDPHIFAALVNRLRERIPGITIRTTLMVGFPGETDAQFQDLLDFVRQVEFDRLGVFAYSNEKGTAAERLPHQIPSRIKEERRNIIMAAQAEISREKNRKLVGTRQRLLLEQEDGSEGSGRIASQAPEVDGITRVTFDEDVFLGNVYDVLITESDVYDLEGIISGAPGTRKAQPDYYN